MTNNPKLFINILSDFDMPLFLHYSSFCKNYFQIFFFFTIFPFFTNIQQQQLHSCTYRCNNRWGEVIVLRKVSWIAMGLESMFTQLTSKSLSLLAEITNILAVKEGKSAPSIHPSINSSKYNNNQMFVVLVYIIAKSALQFPHNFEWPQRAPISEAEAQENV